jgi:hypothetical protein
MYIIFLTGWKHISTKKIPLNILLEHHHLSCEIMGKQRTWKATRSAQGHNLTNLGRMNWTPASNFVGINTIPCTVLCICTACSVLQNTLHVWQCITKSFDFCYKWSQLQDQVLSTSLVPATMLQHSLNFCPGLSNPAAQWCGCHAGLHIDFCKD